MALVYKIKFTRIVDEKTKFKDLIEKNDNKYYIISNLVSSADGYYDGSFEGVYLEFKFDGISYVLIDILDKEADSKILRKSVLEVVHKITNEIYPEEDYFFDFNGDIILEMREDGIVKRNNKTDFYDDLDY